MTSPVPESSFAASGTFSQSGTVHLSTATSSEYLPWCATAILSAIRRTPARVHVHLLHRADLTAEHRERLAGMVRAAGGSIDFLQPDLSRFVGLPASVASLGGSITCARLLLPELLPHVDRVLYLDADTLSTDSLVDLHDAPLDGHLLGAVRNVVHPDLHERLRGLGLDPRAYLNSGVLVMDLAGMRADGLVARFSDLISSRAPELDWGDQDALNIVFQDAWRQLHPRWNAQNSLWTWRPWAVEVFGAPIVDEAVAAPGVVHFEGPWLSKPWHYLCAHPYVSAYRSMFAETPWRDTPLQDRTAATRLIRLLPMSYRVPTYIRLQRVRSRRAAVA